MWRSQLLGNKKKKEKEKKLWSDIRKIKYLGKMATPSSSPKAVHTAPCSLYTWNINIYKPEGDS